MVEPTPNTPSSLAAAVAALQTQLPTIAKSQTANVRSEKGSYSYSYADLAQVSRQLLPVMGRLGLAFMARPTLNEDGKLVLAYTLMHTSGEAIDGQPQ